MHSAGLELTKLTYTRLEDNLIRHRGDWCTMIKVGDSPCRYYIPIGKKTLTIRTQYVVSR